ncbi:Alpha/Beta hydrolase protein [Xylariaceae sp. FL0255]|nr:Alpha/Beta hydrolase protein [Xylariaceae sp. FL0255]
MTFNLVDEKRSLSDSWIREIRDAFSEQKLGIKTLFDVDDAVVDIIFVHGLNGHRDHTWSAEKSSESWPRLFLPSSLPEARILTYGYDAAVVSWRASISGNRIGDHSMNLLSALATYRAVDGTDHRPIIFVAHSLGGLIVKDALLTSRTSPEIHLRRILDSVRAVMFLGTPHMGASLALVAEKLAKTVGITAKSNLKVLKMLRKDSEVLARIQTDFCSLLRSQYGAGRLQWDITCCYEELPVAGVGVIVPKESAVLAGYPAIGIHHDHRGMARFASPDDPGYMSVVGELRRWVLYIQNPGSRDDRSVWRKENSNTNRGTVVRDAGGEGDARNSAGDGSVVIWGNVHKSVVVSGTQTIQGNLSFRH